MSYPINRKRTLYGHGNEQTPITQLLGDIGESIKLMNKIIKQIGTTSDTIEERRKL